MSSSLLSVCCVHIYTRFPSSNTTNIRSDHPTHISSTTIFIPVSRRLYPGSCWPCRLMMIWLFKDADKDQSRYTYIYYIHIPTITTTRPARHVRHVRHAYHVFSSLRFVSTDHRSDHHQRSHHFPCLACPPHHAGITIITIQQA